MGAGINGAGGGSLGGVVGRLGSVRLYSTSSLGGVVELASTFGNPLYAQRFKTAPSTL